MHTRTRHYLGKRTKSSMIKYKTLERSKNSTEKGDVEIGGQIQAPKNMFKTNITHGALK